MRRSLLPSWLGIGLLGLSLTCGCQHLNKGCPTCGASAGGVAAAPRPSSYAPAVVSQPTTPYHVTPTAPVEAPVLHTVAKPAAVELPASAMISNSTAIPAIEPSAAPGMTTLGHEGLLPRRTFTDLTAHPRFAHDPTYNWLVGTLDYSKIQDAWVLRYASVEEDDRYGGSVTLVNPPGIEKFKSGQLVRVEGSLKNADAQELRPPYLVQNIRAVGP